MNVLCLDAGGSKGIYQIGILTELEGNLDRPLHETFQYIYGVGTGAITSALVGLGYAGSDIYKIFSTLIPVIMNRPTCTGRSEELTRELDLLFEDMDLTAFSPTATIGIVAPGITPASRIIFRSDPLACEEAASHSSEPASASIADALLASCALYPFREVSRSLARNPPPVSVGFTRTNPLLPVIRDLSDTEGHLPPDTRIISLGAGQFPVRPLNTLSRYVEQLRSSEKYEQLAMADAQAVAVETERRYPDIHLVRISDEYTHPDHATNMVDRSSERLDMLYQLGRQSFANHAARVMRTLTGKTI